MRIKYASALAFQMFGHQLKISSSVCFTSESHRITETADYGLANAELNTVFQVQNSHSRQSESSSYFSYFSLFRG